MADISFKLDGIEELTKLADKHPAIAEKHVNNAIFKIFVILKSEFKKNAPYGVSQKHMRDAWSIEMERFAGKLKSETKYAGAVETGSRPHWVPIKELELWATSKGLNPYAVQKSIAKKGTKANPFIEKSMNATKNQAEKILKEAVENIASDLSK